MIRSFALHPFSKSGVPPGMTLSGSIFRHTDTLTLAWKLTGPIDRIKIPAVTTNQPARKDRLWEQTCFELFLKADGADAYREFNCAPSGCWNVYRFDDYRKGMAGETAFSALPFEVSRQADRLKITLELNLQNTFAPGSRIRAALSAVLQSENGKISFWALIHPGTKPDFHHPDGFVIDL